MLTSHEHRFHYMMPAKTATGTIAQSLDSLYSCVDPPRAGDKPSPETEDYYPFASVRNPFSRAVSFWSYLRYRDPGLQAKVRRHAIRKEVCGLTFEQFTCHPEFLAMLGQLSELVRGVRLDALIRFESLLDDVAKLQLPRVDQLVDEISRNHYNQGQYGPSWQEHYTEDAEDRIRLYFWPDFKRVDYSFNLAEA